MILLMVVITGVFVLDVAVQSYQNSVVQAEVEELEELERLFYTWAEVDT